jgi:hypothetical protein
MRWDEPFSRLLLDKISDSRRNIHGGTTGLP